MTHLKKFLHPLLILLVVIVVHGPAIHDQFLSDDYDHLMFARTVHDWPSFVRIVKIPGGTYRPVMNVSMTADYLIWGYRPFGFHLTNMLLLAGMALLLYGIIHRLSKRSELALASSLLFVAFPSHQETVTWLAGRTDLLAGFFVLGAIYALIRCRERMKPWWLAVSYLAAGLAYFSKEEAFTLPLLLAVLIGVAIWKKRTALWRGLVVWAPYVILLAGHLLIRKLVIGSWLGGYSWLGSGSSASIPLKFFLLPFYLVKYAVNYAFAAKFVPGLGSAHVVNLISLIILASITGYAILLNRDRWHHRAWWLTIAGLLVLTYVLALPGASIIPNLRLSLMNTRVLFFASMPVVILVAYLFDRPHDHRSIGHQTIGSILVVCIFVAFFNYLPWRIAAHEVQGLTTSLQKLKPQYASVTYDTYPHAILFTHVPDSYYGAFVLRNGLGQSLRIGLSNPTIFINATLTLITNVKQDVTGSSRCAFKAPPHMDGIDVFDWQPETQTIIENKTAERLYAEAAPGQAIVQSWTPLAGHTAALQFNIPTNPNVSPMVPVDIHHLSFTATSNQAAAIKFSWQSMKSMTEPSMLDRGSIAIPITAGTHAYTLDLQTCPNWFLSNTLLSAQLVPQGSNTDLRLTTPRLE